MELNELKRRRLALISRMPRNSVAILSSANKNYRTKDVENPYRQNSDFLYITGLSEPNLINLIFKENEKINSILFRDNTSEYEMVWDGTRIDNDTVQKMYDFTEVHRYNDYKDKILDFIKNKEKL